MAKATKLSNEEQLAAYFEKLEHPLLEVINELRQVILATDQEVGEQIKWNSPAYYYTGAMKDFDPKEYKRDIIVFNLHKKDQVMLVFPTGATINDNTGLLGGKFPDARKTAIFTSLTEVKARAQDLQAVVKAWLALVEK